MTPRVAAALILTALLAGCGRVGLLERPAPLWGDKAKAQRETPPPAPALPVRGPGPQVPDGAAQPVPRARPGPTSDSQPPQ